MKLLNKLYPYGSCNNFDICLELIKNNSNCKQIVYNRITNNTYGMNELNLNEESGSYDKTQWISLCKYDDYIKSRFTIYEFLYPKKIYYPYLFNRYY